MSDRFLSFGSLLIACVVVFVQSAMLGSWMLDDAFIFFRYAENWAGGHGLLFNVGEPPVEGFTSFLWLAILTIANICGFDLVSAAVVLGHVAICGTLLLVSQSWRVLSEVDGRTAAVATLFLGTCGSFTAWARSGMETGLQALLIVSAVILCLRAKERPTGFVQFVAIGIIFALIGMNRPDGLLVVAVLAVDALVARRQLGARAIAVTALVFVVGFGGYYAWRCSYFGYPVPNTFYVKVGSSGSQFMRGLVYVRDSFITLAPMVALLLVVGRGWLRVNANYVVLPVLVLVYTAYIVAVGGDVMPAQRFFTPILPVLAVLAAMALRTIAAAWRWAAVVPAVGYGLAILFMSVTATIRGDVVALNGKIAGLWLRENAPKGSTIATNTAGTVVYYSGLRAIDMLGLNDLHIAHVEMPQMGSGPAGHEKGDGEYVLAQNPEFIQLGSSVGWAPMKIAPEPPFVGDRQMWHNPTFRERYKPLYRKGETLWPDGTVCGVFGFWVRADVHAKLERDK